MEAVTWTSAKLKNLSPELASAKLKELSEACRHQRRLRDRFSPQYEAQ